MVVHVVSDEDLQDTYILRESLEGAAARLATRNATQPELYALREIARQFADAVESKADSKELDAINRRFHTLLYRSSHSRLLERILEPLHLATNRDKRSVFQFSSRPEESAEEHSEMVKALLKRDADLAERLAREHVRRGGEVRSLLIAERLVSEAK
jgi:DNA-binding GntR family transcriptional regulator